MRVAIFVVICLAVIGILLIIYANKNDQGGYLVESPSPLEQQRSRAPREQDSPSPEQRRWDSIVEDTRRDSTYKLLSVEESREWLAKHSEPYNYAVEATDPDGNRRVFLPKDPLPSPDPLKGYLTAEQSINWLERQGYQVVKDDKGYILKKEAVGGGINLSENIRIGWGSTVVREDATITTRTGEIRIKPSE